MLRAVRDSEDLQRILALPRRVLDYARVPFAFEHLQVPARSCRCREYKRACPKNLLPLQSWALFELAREGGVLGNIQVGAGKTLIGLLAPMVTPRCRKAILFVQADLKPQLLEVDWGFYGQHWRLPNLVGGSSFTAGRPALHVLSYHELQNQKSTALLEQIGADLICFDEVHNIKDVGGVRAIRILRYAEAHPETRFGGWSGTLTTKSVLDHAHVSALTLGYGSPLPLNPSTVEEWAACVDPGLRGQVAAPGDLRKFCADANESVRSGMRRRFVETPGVVSSEVNAIGNSLVFHGRMAQIPDVIKNAVRKAEMDERPDGAPLEEITERDRCIRQLLCGFYYRWRWMHGETPEMITEWLAARKAWNAELRARMASPRQWLDSPALCTEAAARWYGGGCSECARGPRAPHAKNCSRQETAPLWPSETWPWWARVADTCAPVTEAVWLSSYLVDDAAEWLAKEPGIAWCRYEAFASALAKAAGVPLYGRGTEASTEILHETGERSIVASIAAHGTGKNLQMFSRNLFANSPPGGGVCEQTIGRTLRQGQLADRVEVTFYRHAPQFVRSLDVAREEAEYVFETKGLPQKLLYGSYTFKP